MGNAATGAIFGVLIAAWVFAEAPPPPIYAFGCAVLDYPAAVLMNGELVCLREAEIVSNEAMLNAIAERVRALAGEGE